MIGIKNSDMKQVGIAMAFNLSQTFEEMQKKKTDSDTDQSATHGTARKRSLTRTPMQAQECKSPKSLLLGKMIVKLESISQKRTE